MSYTVTRGRHTAKRWLAAADEVHEALGDGRVPKAGALAAMERFFEWMLDGVRFEMCRERDSSISIGASESAFYIGQSVFAELYHIAKPPLGRMKLRGEVMLKLLQQIEQGGSLPPHRSNEIARLRQFLKILIHHGLHSANLQRRMADDDD